MCSIFRSPFSLFPSFLHYRLSHRAARPLLLPPSPSELVVAFFLASCSFSPARRVRVGEGVEVGRPYGPGLPGFVPKLVLLYGVSLEKSLAIGGTRIRLDRW